MIAEERLAALEMLEAQATPGPWVGVPPEGYRGHQGGIVDVCSFGIEAADYCSVAGDPPTPEDMAFIIEARTALPDLLAEVRQLQAALSRAHG